MTVPNYEAMFPMIRHLVSDAGPMETWEADELEEVAVKLLKEALGQTTVLYRKATLPDMQTYVTFGTPRIEFGMVQVWPEDINA